METRNGEFSGSPSASTQSQRAQMPTLAAICIPVLLLELLHFLLPALCILLCSLGSSSSPLRLAPPLHKCNKITSMSIVMAHAFVRIISQASTSTQVLQAQQ